jgi:Zn-dependent protease/CBS domain-containing protein
MWSYEIGKIKGIPIKIHITFLLVLPLFVFVFSVDNRFGFGDFPSPYNYIWGLVTAILLFVSVLLHELGHSLVAMRYGSRILGITLFIFGGVSQIEEISKKPSEEAKMAFVGPLVSFVIGTTLLALYMGLSVFMDGGIIRVLRVLGFINILLGAFNLIPAFPMDGGRILRAYFATKYPYTEATRKAAFIGKIFAFIMGLVGVFVSIWLVLIAFFIYIGASEEESATRMKSVLEGVKVRELMSENIVYALPDMRVSELLELMFHTRYAGYPVVSRIPENGLITVDDVVGIVTFRDLQRVPFTQREIVFVKDVMNPIVETIDVDNDVSEALKKLQGSTSGRLLVVENDRVVGIISRTDIVRALQILSVREET